MRNYLAIFILLLTQRAGAALSYDIESAINFIRSHTPYTEASLENLPPIVVLSEKSFNERYGETTLGIYSVEDAEIYFSEAFPYQDGRLQAYLIHELVHHFQIQRGEEFACEGAMEREAYDAQIAYLEQEGLPTAMNPIIYKVLTTCLDRPAYL